MTFIDDSLAYDVARAGEFVGKQTPTRESKWTYYAIYRFKNKVYALIVDGDGDILSGEEINENEISQYI